MCYSYEKILVVFSKSRNVYMFYTEGNRMEIEMSQTARPVETRTYVNIALQL